MVFVMEWLFNEELGLVVEVDETKVARYWRRTRRCRCRLG